MTLRIAHYALHIAPQGPLPEPFTLLINAQWVMGNAQCGYHIHQ
jgi:hypothetical protein